MKFEFIQEALYLPEKEILVIGDLHIGYEYNMIKSGILTPRMQNQKIIEELRNVILKIKESHKPLKKIIFLGDIKHSFEFQYPEKIEFKDVYEFLKQHFKENNIIFIKGNHDTIDFTYGKMKNFHIEKDIAFIHGHKQFLPIYDKKIKTIIMGHIHPSIIFHDKDTIKKERYKCFLIGKFQKKQVIILPSFLGFSTGHSINNYDELYKEGFSIIPKKQLMNFKVHVIGKDKSYEFKKIKGMQNI